MGDGAAEGTGVWARSHHHAILVADQEASIEFYASAFGARLLFGPIELRGHAAAEILDGPRGLCFRLAMLGLSEGAVELFELVGEEVPAWPLERGRLPHLALEVASVTDSIERVKRAGGRPLFDQPQVFGSTLMTYVADLDGNVVELLEASAEEVARQMVSAFPNAAPGAGGPA
jgi:catechol 2,3-dioxygenase-like lactoylglutathione lyase family enzyme